ncbi:MAG: hypothetical protein IJ381_06870 [Clostridia bacterium]|nr:hypothetical protein [Clostridia bacterium]
MRDWLVKLRAVISPQIVLLLLASLVLIGGGLMNREEKSDVIQTDLEQRIGRALSSMEGAGKVIVVLRTDRTAQEKTGKSKTETETVVGAIAVAQGADNPLIVVELQEALCALLGLPASAVSVVAGGK